MIRQRAIPYPVRSFRVVSLVGISPCPLAYYRRLVWFGDLHPLAVDVSARRPVLLAALVSVVVAVASLSPLAPMLACVRVGVLVGVCSRRGGFFGV